MNLSRRHFLAGAAAATLPISADPLGIPIGCQTYPVRDAIEKDWDGLLRQLASIGYKSIELCSPAGYKEFASLGKMKPAELRKSIEAAGLRCESCHFGFREMKDKLDDSIAFAKELGLKQMVLASFGLRRDAAITDYKRAAGELNQAGEKVQKAGIQLGYHNHDNEFKELNGVLIYDALMKELDPRLVKMQFQVSVISLGYEAATYMTKYPGRFCSLHLQDWSPSEKKQVAVGQGSVDWKKLFAAAKTGGVKNYFVEMNLEAMKASVPYLHGFKT